MMTFAEILHDLEDADKELLEKYQEFETSSPKYHI
jgi:hypothetical protein